MKKREIEAKEREKNVPKNPKKKKRENNKLFKNLNKQFIITRNTGGEHQWCSIVNFYFLNMSTSVNIERRKMILPPFDSSQ
jgi:hypothetical protein